jgi:hypothetical protein
VISTVPAVPAGDDTSKVLSLTTVKESAAFVPKLTPVAPVKWLPVTVMRSPPAALPEEGLTPLTDGDVALVYVKWSDEPVDEVPA